MVSLAVPQLKGCTLGEIHQRGVLHVAFHLVMRPARRLLEVVGQMLVEILVILVLQLALGPRPEGAGLIDDLAFFIVLLQADGQANVIGVLAGDE